MSGDDIRRARQEMSLTQDDLAEAIGVTRKTVSNWERGIAVPRTRLAALLKFLRLQQDEGVRIGPSLRDASNIQLLAELLTRMREGRIEDLPLLDRVIDLDVPKPKGD